MIQRKIQNISQKECLKIYKEFLNNADAKWDSGTVLENSGDYGGAMSLKIISIEELIKAIVLFLDGHGFQFRNLGMGTFFKDHKIRYFVAYGMFVVGIFGEEAKYLLLKAQENPDKKQKFLEDATKDPSGFLNKYKFYLWRRFVRLKDELVFFSNIDLMRQSGLYADYDGQIVNPISINKIDYQNLLHRLELVRDVGKISIEMVNPQDIDLYNQFKNIDSQMRNNDGYNKIGKFLADLHKTRKTPFDFAFEDFKSIRD